MIKRLQDISFRVSRYFRPLEPWHCGGLEDGSNCLLGPDKQGNCRSIRDCTPDQEGKTWTCTRSELLGGPCKAGPSAHGACGRQRPPCKPTRNIRARRQRFGWLAAAVALAVTGLVVAIDNWQEPTNPGALSQQHAGFGETDCQACHETALAPKSSWLSKAFSAHNAVTDSKNCVACHVMGEESLATHSLSNEKLAALTESINARMADESYAGKGSGTSMLVKLAKFVNSDEGQAPACSVCHQEHQGSGADISQISDQQCAVCHTNAFDKFSSHVDFSNYPASKRTQIIFSHNTHLNKHFAEEDLQAVAPTACVDCHISDPIGRKMEVAGFEQTCSACHAEQVTGESRAGDKGFAMLSIPALDVDSLAERGVKIGDWPAYSDAEFTPLNKLLVLATNPSLKDRMADFSALDLYDLSGASAEEMQLVYEVIWTLKRVYFELQRSGARTVSRRLSSTMGIENESAAKMFALLPAAVVEQATNDAFPNLESEMVAWLEQGKPEFAVSEPVKQVQQEAPAKAAPATSSAEDDDWLSGALDDDDSEDASDDDWLSAVADDEGDDSDGDDWLNAAADDEDEGDDWLSSSLEEEESDDGDDWLNAAADDEEDDWLSEASGDSASALEDDDVDAQEMTDSEKASAGIPVPELLSAEERAAIGGWYYENYYLRYRPTGHADRLIVTWIDGLTDAMKNGAKIDKALTVAMQRNLLGESTPGSCMKCHSVDEPTLSDTGIAKVHWIGHKTKPAMHDFNAFKHQSHFAVVDKASDDFASSEASGCRSCHTINAESDSGVAYESDSNGHFESDFHDLEKQQCATCHETPKSMASCTQCHNYHIGERGLTGIEDGFRSAIETEDVANE